VDNNPKTRMGALKVDLSLIPPASIIYEALALEEGGQKYGPYNWRSEKVSTRTYIAAAMRHLQAYLDGEDTDPESHKPHLAHAKASIGILIDAAETGNLINDRPPVGRAGDLLREWRKKGEQLELPLEGTDVPSGFVVLGDTGAEARTYVLSDSAQKKLRESLKKNGYWNDEHADMLKDVPAHDRIIPRF
jgi:hypothetical protein